MLYLAMCELLGMSSNKKTNINISLSTLAQRGENPHFHGDGWGVAFYEDKDVRLIKDVGEAKKSDWVHLIKKEHILSHDVIAHIRKSTVGKVSYSNTHPFIRELFGRVHTFAHNGTLVGIDEKFKTKNFHPVGSTDSEKAFCLLMDRMMELWHGHHDLIPALTNRIELIEEFSKEMRQLGPINFLYSDGEIMVGHGHKRHDPVTNKVEWPGLHFNHLICDEFSEAGVTLSSSTDRMITLFASVPLDDDGNWKPLREGQIVAVRKGEIVYLS